MRKSRSRTPIDNIWISPGIEILQCGFLPFHDYKGFDSDHQLIWVEIDNASLFGHYPQQMWKAPSTRVRSNDPRCRDRYIERVLQQYEEENVFAKPYDSYASTGTMERKSDQQLKHHMRN
jgi:hypothetical protein